MKLMNLDIVKIRRIGAAGYDLNKIVPGIFHQDSHVISKQGAVLEWIIPTFEREKKRLMALGTLNKAGGKL